MARQDAGNALPREIRETLRAMNWEARLEDARRRRTAILAAREAMDRMVPPPPPPSPSALPLVLDDDMRVRAWPASILKRVRDDTSDVRRVVPTLARESRAVVGDAGRAVARASKAVAGHFVTAARGIGANEHANARVAELRDGVAGIGPAVQGGMRRLQTRLRRAGTAVAESREAVPVFRSVRQEHLPILAFGLISVALFSAVFVRGDAPRPPQVLSAVVLPHPAEDKLPAAIWTKPPEAAQSEPAVEARKLAALTRPDAPSPVAGPVKPEPAAFHVPKKPVAPVDLLPQPIPASLPAGPEPVAKVAPEPPAPIDSRIRVRAFLPRTAAMPLGSLSAEVDSDARRLDRVQKVDYRISATHVRYYHAGDRAEAERLAAATGGEARDFTKAERLPETGYLELYLAGDAAAKPVVPETVDEQVVKLIGEIFR